MTLRDWWLGLKLSFQSTAPQEQVLALDCFTADARSMLRSTFRRAAFFGSALATCRHLVLEGLEREPAFAACIRALELEVDVVRDAIAAPLGDEQESVEAEAVADVRADRVLWVVAVVAREQKKHGTTCGTKDLIANALAYDAALAGELDAFGVSRYALSTWFSHGVLAHAPIHEDSLAEHDALDVWLDNDDRTPMDFVVDVLTRDLDLKTADAIRLMREVHERGKARVHTLPRADAIGRANAILERGRIHGFPLRVRVEKPK